MQRPTINRHRLRPANGLATWLGFGIRQVSDTAEEPMPSGGAHLVLQLALRDRLLFMLTGELHLVLRTRDGRDLAEDIVQTEVIIPAPRFGG